jgi:hypothetical protein
MNLRDPALGYSLGEAGRSAMGKGLISSDVNHAEIKGSVKASEKLQPPEARVDG